MRELRMVPLSSLREPADAARTEMDDAQLDDLCVSIRQLGVLEPLLVTPREDDTFEVVAGHRRLLASRAVGLVDAPCIIVTETGQLDAIKLHENQLREELNPVDEALWLAGLYERHGEDTERLAELVRRPRSYVEERLLLLRGYPEVRDALRSGKIGLGVARAFNRLKRPEDVGYYLGSAVRGGCTERQARDWVGQANARADFMAEAAASPEAAGVVAGGATAPAPLVRTYAAQAAPHEMNSSLAPAECVFCGFQAPTWKLFTVLSCDPCRLGLKEHTGR